MVVYLIITSLYSPTITMMPSTQMCERIGNEIVKMDTKKKTTYKCVK